MLATTCRGHGQTSAAAAAAAAAAARQQHARTPQPHPPLHAWYAPADPLRPQVVKIRLQQQHGSSKEALKYRVRGARLEGGGGGQRAVGSKQRRR